MSEDIVGRLRSPVFSIDFIEETERTMQEAADEIERLRTALDIEQRTVRQLQEEIEFASPHEGKPYG